MAQLAQAAVLIEATTSGTRHQIAACASLGRPVFVPMDLLDRLDWLRSPSARSVVTTWRDVPDAVRLVREHLGRAPRAGLA